MIGSLFFKKKNYLSILVYYHWLGAFFNFYLSRCSTIWKFLTVSSCNRLIGRPRVTICYKCKKRGTLSLIRLWLHIYNFIYPALFAVNAKNVELFWLHIYSFIYRTQLRFLHPNTTTGLCVLKFLLHSPCLFFAAKSKYVKVEISWEIHLRLRIIKGYLQFLLPLSSLL